MKIPENEPQEKNTVQYVKRKANEARRVWKATEEIINKKQTSYGNWANREKGERTFEQFQLVLISRDEVPKKGEKFRELWEGPYRIIGIRRPNLIVKSLMNEKMKTIHMDRAKIFHESRPLPLRTTDEDGQKWIVADPNLEQSEEEEE